MSYITYNVNQTVYVNQIGYGTLIECGKFKSISIKSEQVIDKKQSIYFDPQMFNIDGDNLELKKIQTQEKEQKSQLPKTSNAQTLVQRKSQLQLKQQMPQRQVNIVTVKLENTQVMVYTQDINIKKTVSLIIKPLITNNLSSIVVDIDINKTLDTLKKMVFDKLSEPIINYHNIRFYTTSPILNQLNVWSKTIAQYSIKNYQKIILQAYYAFGFKDIPQKFKDSLTLSNNSNTIARVPQKPIIASQPIPLKAQQQLIKPKSQNQPLIQQIKNPNQILKVESVVEILKVQAPQQNQAPQKNQVPQQNQAPQQNQPPQQNQVAKVEQLPKKNEVPKVDEAPKVAVVDEIPKLIEVPIIVDVLKVNQAQKVDEAPKMEPKLDQLPKVNQEEVKAIQVPKVNLGPNEGPKIIEKIVEVVEIPKNLAQILKKEENKIVELFEHQNLEGIKEIELNKQMVVEQIKQVQIVKEIELNKQMVVEQIKQVQIVKKIQEVKPNPFLEKKIDNPKVPRSIQPLDQKIKEKIIKKIKQTEKLDKIIQKEQQPKQKLLKKELSIENIIFCQCNNLYIQGRVQFITGRHYWQFKIDKALAQDDIWFGVMNQQKDITYAYLPLCAKKYCNKQFTDYGYVAKQSDMIGVLLQFNKQKKAELTFYKNSISCGKFASDLIGPLIPIAGLGKQSQVSIDSKAQYPIQSYRNLK